ncbi:MAG: lysine--tRNA ligase [Candidatus Gracilibacteria bacterium]
MSDHSEQEILQIDPLKERTERLRKLSEIKEMGIQPYPERFEKTHSIAQILKISEDENNIKTVEEISANNAKTYRTAGRIVMSRTHGKLSFLHLLDDSGKMQLALMQDLIGKDTYKFFEKKVDLGDFIGIAGELFRTKHGEVTVLVTEFTFLGKALRPLPDKFHGLKDRETLYRQRYLDLISNQETKKRFQFRSNFIKALREFYWSKGFDEVETPILTTNASGALATPFKTYHNALDTEMYLRIAPETFLKECVVGGYEKVFEIGRIFRNEGIDPSHLQDFTMVEHYAAYWNYEDNMKFTEEMFTHLLMKLNGSMKVNLLDKEGVQHEIDFTPPWPRVTFRDLLIKDADIDLADHKTVESLREAIREKNIHIEGMDKLGLGNLIDHLYKKVSRPKIISPTFLIGHPLDLSPLARKNDDNPAIVDRFQLVVATWEVLNAYSELVDPLDQKERFESQSSAKDAGDTEAHSKDDEYVEAMEYGMPPISGFGMGIDRMVTLLTQQENLRDTVLFPLMRPKK